MSEENIITYETFRKFQRMERENQALQKLPEDFYKSCHEWIKRKSESYEKTKDNMILKEIENVMSIIKDILDRRERKLLSMAIQTVRSNIPPKNLLSHEEKCFDVIVEHLKEMRENILNEIKEGYEKSKEEQKKSPEKSTPPVEVEKTVQKEPKPSETDKFKLIRILDDVPQFLGVDGKVYGPLKKDDLITLEDKIADLLVSKNKAEYVEI